MPERQTYVLDTARLTADQQVAACRLALCVVAMDVASFEADIPWAPASEWPVDVTQAAQHLSSLKPPGRGESDLYGCGCLSGASAGGGPLYRQGSRRPSCAPSDGLRRVAASFYD